MVAPRRIGKTGLIKNAFYLLKEQHPEIHTYYMDVMGTQNLNDFVTLLGNTVLGTLESDFQKAIKFLKRWQQYFKKQLTEEEKKLGEKANQLRLENYANLRENGNKVWHGKLAGQLLADVLEKDFMEAI